MKIKNVDGDYCDMYLYICINTGLLYEKKVVKNNYYYINLTPIKTGMSDVTIYEVYNKDGIFTAVVKNTDIENWFLTIGEHRDEQIKSILE